MSPVTHEIPELKAGQMWSIKPPAPTTAKVIIGRLENWHGNEIVHVSVVDIPIGGSEDVSPQTTTLGHAPFDKAALVSSLDKLLADGQLPSEDILDSIAEWRAANGGVWTVSVAEVLGVIF
jgi:hypothetical protein